MSVFMVMASYNVSIYCFLYTDLFYGEIASLSARFLVENNNKDKLQVVKNLFSEIRMRYP